MGWGRIPGAVMAVSFYIHVYFGIYFGDPSARGGWHSFVGLAKVSTSTDPPREYAGNLVKGICFTLYIGVTLALSP